jgi:hypothetical protein
MPLVHLYGSKLFEYKQFAVRSDLKRRAEFDVLCDLGFVETPGKRCGERPLSKGSHQTRKNDGWSPPSNEGR